MGLYHPYDPLRYKKVIVIWLHHSVCVNFFFVSVDYKTKIDFDVL